MRVRQTGEVLLGEVNKWVQNELHLHQDTVAEAMVGVGVLKVGPRVQGLLAQWRCY